MSPGEIHGLHARIVADLKRELAEARAEIEQQRTRAEAAEQELQSVAKTVGATGDDDDVVAFVERAVAENVRRSALLNQAANNERSAKNNAEALSSIDEALGSHFACIDGHNPYTEERVPMLVEDYERTKAKLAAIRAHLPALKRLHAWVSSDDMGKWTYLEGGTFYDDVQEMAAIVADALEALEP